MTTDELALRITDLLADVEPDLAMAALATMLAESARRAGYGEESCRTWISLAFRDPDTDAS